MPDRTDQAVPADVRALADARALARAERDWDEADRLRAEIEAAGWTVRDRGFSYSLQAAHPPDVTEGGVVRYGRSESVPSRLGEPSTVPATVLLVATDRPADLSRVLVGLRTDASAGTQVVVVADGPSAEQDAALGDLAMGAGAAGSGIEVVRTSVRLGPAAALAIGLRRATGSVVISLDTSLEPTGDLVTPLVAALDDPTIAVAGDRGLVTTDFRHFDPAPAGDVDVIDASCQAFRRADVAARGPLDERFGRRDTLGIWWSLVLRDEGVDVPPRRALALADLPVIRHADDAAADAPTPGRDRVERRDAYRILDRFGRRPDLSRSASVPRPRGRA